MHIQLYMFIIIHDIIKNMYHYYFLLWHNVHITFKLIILVTFLLQ